MGIYIYFLNSIFNKKLLWVRARETALTSWTSSWQGRVKSSWNFFFNRKWFSPPPSLSTTHFFMQKHWGKSFSLFQFYFHVCLRRINWAFFSLSTARGQKKKKRLMSRRRSIKTDFFKVRQKMKALPLNLIVIYGQTFIDTTERGWQVGKK